MKVIPKSRSTSGRLSRPGRRHMENEEIQTYLSKLKDLVPFMPKNRKLSKLEVIQYVIDYICDLQDALESTPGVSAAAMMAAAAVQQRSPVSSSGPLTTSRQPLGVLAPNSNILSSCSTQEVTGTTLLEKVTVPSDPRPVSV